MIEYKNAALTYF